MAACERVGWLLKTGNLTSAKRYRWVELSGQQLVRSKRRGESPNGVILLDADVKIHRLLDNVSFALRVGPRTYTFSAPTIKECERWIEDIRAACEGDDWDEIGRAIDAELGGAARGRGAAPDAGKGQGDRGS